MGENDLIGEMAEPVDLPQQDHAALEAEQERRQKLAEASRKDQAKATKQSG